MVEEGSLDPRPYYIGSYYSMSVSAHFGCIVRCIIYPETCIFPEPARTIELWRLFGMFAPLSLIENGYDIGMYMYLGKCIRGKCMVWGPYGRRVWRTFRTGMITHHESYVHKVSRLFVG